jgi:hypothetical protein
MTFESDVKRFVELVERRLKNVVSNSMYALSTKIVLQTPVDTPYGPNGEFPVWFDANSVGEARGGWVAGKNGSTRTSASLDPEGGATNTKNQAVYQTYNPRIDVSLSLSNDVSYIGDLEFGRYEYPNPIKSVGGYSFQAPTGMMRINTRQWPSIVREVRSRVR